MSGLQMNKQKTELFHVGLSQEDSTAISGFGFQFGTLPIWYLGLPLLHRKLRKQDYSPLMDKVSERFNGWAVKCLSFADRLQLVSSVIYGLINFWMSAFALPKGCIKALEKLCNAFLWSGDITKRTNAKSNSSWIWRFLLSLRLLVKTILRCKIGNGHTASYWFDNWNTLGILNDVLGSRSPLQLGLPITATVAEACNHNG
ncbi:PREDICTED: uncharacterized protein LOC104728245 [Camelina sativa]|uniref:Uncharacterized protein LOC104728245 n=1 Tax=Camelina sativa TaxID=90675 RepID=A0ABM0USI9_CAMSA|nr:PREDICTED: uncharacterized protein LOC104728245 [Camelina sativa]